MAYLRAEYSGSRSMRAGMKWLDFATLGMDNEDTVMVLRTGVVCATEGRLSAAGSMSGMAAVVNGKRVYGSERG